MKLPLKRERLPGLASLRRMAARPSGGERCELCAAPVVEGHQHLMEPSTRRLLCACDACAILFDATGRTQYRRVPRDVRQVSGLEINEALWNTLGIPVQLVFVFRSSVSAGVLALYPSPAGPTEAALEEDAWLELAAQHPSIASMCVDVEALLLNRTRDAREAYIVPIDECYRLTGLIRKHWKGFSGGDDAWREIRTFFDALKQRSQPERIVSHA